MIAAADSVEGRLQYAFHTALIREPSSAEVDRLTKLVADVSETYLDAIDDAKKMATDPLGELPDSADPVEFATWTVVANVILNLDEMLMKR